MLYDKLFDYQKKIVDTFKERDSMGLFLDMGLGKTILSLAFAEQNNCTKVVVITINAKAEEPITIKDSWLGWASQSNISYTFHTKHTSNSFAISQNDLLLLNYESLFVRKKEDKKSKVTLKQNLLDFAKSCKGHNVAIIVDESHKMKNLQSLQTSAIFQLKKYLTLYSNKVYTYLLTGTPFTTGYIDLYTQLKMLGYSATKSSFIDEYCVRGNLPGLLGWQQPIVGYKNLDALFRLVHKYALTIQSEDVIKLPEQIFVDHTIKESNEFMLFTHEQLKRTQILEECHSRHINNTFTLELAATKEKFVNNPFFRNIAYPDLKWLAETNGTFWLRARQLSIGFQGNAEDATWYDNSRYEEIEKFLKNNVDNYVIFYNYTAELFELFSICEKLGYNIDVYCGEIKSLHHYEKFSALSDSEQLITKGNVILANFASGSTGMNWQRYNKCLITSIPLYKDYAQGIKRIHRPGQKYTTIYHIFYQQNWLDYGMRKSLQLAKDYTQEMFESDLKRVKEITELI